MGAGFTLVKTCELFKEIFYADDELVFSPNISKYVRKQHVDEARKDRQGMQKKE